MSIILIIIAVLYGLGAVLSLIVGVINMLENADYGEDNKDFQSGRLQAIYCLIWPYGLKKGIDLRLGREEK